MVCYSVFSGKKCAFLLGALFACLVLCGCNYHGRIRRNIYKVPSFQDKIDLSVLVVTDRYLPEQKTLSRFDPYSPGKYIFRTDDGVAVAAADALGTLFTRVDAGPNRFASRYDYVAEIDYSVERDDIHSRYITREDDHFYWRERVYDPGLKTSVRLTLRAPHSRQAALMLYASRRHDVTYGVLSQSLYWLNRVTLSLLYPVLTPPYMQTTGTALRKGLEKDLAACLREIMDKLEENRFTLSKTHDQELLPRRDEAYRPFLEKTVYLETPNAHGTGFFISADGYLITNAHVAGNERDVRYYLYSDLPFTPFRDEPPFRYARVVTVNKSRDLALLKAEGNFPYFELDSDRSHYKTGDTVLAVGNPQDKLWTVTQGIISALNDFNGTDEIQVDAAVNLGNSGGPLVLKSTGKAIGVASRMLKPGLGSGMGYAISAYEVERTLGIKQPVDEEKLRREEVKNAREKK